MGWLLFAAIVLVLFQLRMAKTILVLGLTIYSLALIGLAFLMGVFLTFFLGDFETIRHWQIGKGWVTEIVDSEWISFNFWVVIFLPVIFIADCVKWMFYLWLTQGTLWTTVMLFVGLWGAGRVWYYGLSSYADASKLNRPSRGSHPSLASTEGGKNVPYRESAYQRGIHLARWVRRRWTK